MGPPSECQAARKLITGRLVRNPASGVNLPRVVVGERRYLSHEQVHALATECGPYRLIVLFLAYTGVRFGELAALRFGKLHLLRRRATISEAVTEVNGALGWGTPKGHERRDVPIPRFLVDELAEKVAGKAHDELVFPGTRGSALRVRVVRRGGFDAAIERLSLAPMHPHEVRHTAASLAMVSGADVKVVQQMLGQVSDHDTRPVRPPIRRSARRSARECQGLRKDWEQLDQAHKIA